MHGFITDIEQETVANTAFRKVLYTGRHSQLVLMSLKPGEDIDLEIHNDNDQFFRFEQGEGICFIDSHEHKVKDGSAVVIPAGAEHNILNTSKTEDLKMYTIYSPPHHQDGILRQTKAEAVENEADFDGVTTE